MGRGRWLSAAAGAVLALALAVGHGCATPDPRLEPDASRILRQMSDLLAGTEAFRLRCTATTEERLESGQLAQFERDAKILVARPDRLHAAVRRGPDSYQYWHQGEQLTVLDERRNLYAVVPTPRDNGEMLDFLADEYGMVMPLADLLFPDPYAVLTEQVTSGTRVDEQPVGDRPCHHLLFTQDNLDWQIWIDTGTAPVPRRVVITYLDDPEAPQFDAVLDEWQRATPGEQDFAPRLPPGARQVELDELLDAR